MTQGLKYDILVIGAGPAGATAALSAVTFSPIALIAFSPTAFRKPPTVCLIDRKKEPGSPVRCGEAIGLKGFDSWVTIDKKWIKNTIVKARLVSPSGMVVTLPGDYQNYVIDREMMERDLVTEAIGKGVDFIPETTIVSVRRNENGYYECRSCSGKIFETSCCILADGVESRVARSLGWNTSLAASEITSCAFARIEHDAIEQGACRFYLGQSIAPGGYAWVFPRGQHTANVGLGILGSLCRSGMPKELLSRFIERYFPGSRISQLHCGGVPNGPWLKPLVKDGVMVAGDAARQVNCTSGAGLAYSFFSGKTAGLAAAQAFVRGDRCNFNLLKKYEKQWASYYGKQQKRSYSLKKTIVKFTDSFYDEIAASLQKVDPGALNVTRVFVKAFSRHPLQLLKVLKLFC
jgi:digeranylgeranylglycerophospholipid reductase